MANLIEFLRDDILNNDEWQAISTILSRGMEDLSKRYFEKVLQLVG